MAVLNLLFGCFGFSLNGLSLWFENFLLDSGLVPLGAAGGAGRFLVFLVSSGC